MLAYPRGCVSDVLDQPLPVLITQFALQGLDHSIIHVLLAQVPQRLDDQTADAVGRSHAPRRRPLEANLLVSHPYRAGGAVGQVDNPGGHLRGQTQPIGRIRPGRLEADTLVTGAGDATISGAATLEFGAASSADTTFADGGDGTLSLDHSSSFTGAVSGFNHGDSLDLGDVAFGSGTGTMLSYSANDAGTGGTLNVSDGANTAQGGLPVHICGKGDVSVVRIFASEKPNSATVCRVLLGVSRRGHG